jgi:hypothetical protein
VRRCEICRCDISDRRSTALTCGPACRAEKSRRRTGRDTRTTGKGKALRGVAKRRRRRVGKRADTAYAVLRLRRAEFQLVGKCKAHDRESAVRELAGGKRGLYIAVPERNLALLNQEGHPDG